MNKQYHILNGDALRQQFPKSLQGEIIVIRECLVEGSNIGNSLEAFFATRAQFISNTYEGFTTQNYYDTTVTEFKKIQNITHDAEINLWFEDDLFCQVNYWFVLNLLQQYHKSNSVFLIRPEKHMQYGFGGLDTSTLVSLYKNRLQLTELNTLATLWESYKTDNLEQLLKTATELKSNYPFILTAVKAHIERIPTKEKLGRPHETLTQIIKELKSDEFEPVFKEFCKRESIYGFGDLQVKRLYDEIKSNL